MRVVTLFGTRPEIIRLSEVIRRLDPVCDHVLVHTGQNFDPRLSDVFFEDLSIRPPDRHLGIRAVGFADQVGQIIRESARVFEELKPDRVLVLGDTNSGLAVIAAARMGIPTYHMEAGNRCYDNRVPEEINRRIIDHSSDVLMPYTHRSKDNLVREGIRRERIFVTGNPINEVIQSQAEAIGKSAVLDRLELAPQKFGLVTLHRAENVDDPGRLKGLLQGLVLSADELGLPMIFSVHPRTAKRIEEFGISLDPRKVRALDPLGFHDFIALEQQAACVLSDSGTVQEECCILRVPSVTVRDVTERAETIECGSNILTGPDPRSIVGAVQVAVSGPRDWSIPPEYLEPRVSASVVKTVLGFRLEQSA